MPHDVARRQLPASKWAGHSHWRTIRWLMAATASMVLLYALYVGILRLLGDSLPAIVITLLVPVSLAPIMAGSARNGRHP